MGDYAKIKTTGDIIKAGCCGDMYYIRADQRDEIIPHDYTPCDRDRYRLPYKHEEGIKVGDFEYNGFHGAEPLRLRCKSFDYESAIESAGSGIVQARHEMGVLANIPCYHGNAGELPKGLHYNGLDTNALAAFSIRFIKGVPHVVIGCIFCGMPLFSVDAKEFERDFAPTWDKEWYKEEFNHLCEWLNNYQQ